MSKKPQEPSTVASDYMSAVIGDSIKADHASGYSPLYERGTMGSGTYKVKGNFLYYDRKDTVAQTTKIYADIVMKLNRQLKLANESGVPASQEIVDKKKAGCQQAIDFLKKELENDFYPSPKEDPYKYNLRIKMFEHGITKASDCYIPPSKKLDNVFRDLTHGNYVFEYDEQKVESSIDLHGDDSQLY